MAVGVNYLPSSERQRPLTTTAFAPSSLLSVNLPRDTVIKRLLITLHGSLTTTYASGTPVADAHSFMDNVIPRIDVKVGGGRTIKSIPPHLAHMSQIFNTVINGVRASSAAATAALDDFPLADGAFAYGTTTQLTTSRESIFIYFENVWANRETRYDTLLNTKGLSSAQMFFTTAAYSSLLGFGNTAPVAYSASTLNIDCVTHEAQHIPVSKVFSDFKESLFQYTHSAQVTNQMQLLNTGNLLQGLLINTRDGAAGSTTTASGKLDNSLVITGLTLKINGMMAIKDTDFKSVQASNRAEYGLSAPFASSVSRLDGVAYLNMLTDKDIRTALDCRPPKVDQLNLYYNTNTSANCSYTNPVAVNVLQQEIVTPA